jgi:hypothetical protein
MARKSSAFMVFFACFALVAIIPAKPRVGKLSEPPKDRRINKCRKIVLITLRRDVCVGKNTTVIDSPALKPELPALVAILLSPTTLHLHPPRPPMTMEKIDPPELIAIHVSWFPGL